ncbi:hypothetical protein F5Y09DRAFT_291070 [Xylaria sp. FL1042]|nr:hypothetical protein F5Y09DRAFT_291070 [Xylaria sp. FL1042]
MGDMDEDLPEEDIVRRKIEAINAMVAYAFVCELLQRAQPEPRAKPLPTRPSEVILLILSGRPIIPKPGPAQSTLSSLASEILLCSPLPLYSEFDSGARHCLTISARDAAITSGRRRFLYARKKPDPCIFCGKTYTRTNVLWDHLEDHLERAKGGPLACPREECKGMVLESPGRFKAHAARFHGSSFRVRIKLVTSESVKPPVGSATASARPITLVPSENQTRPPGSGPMYTPTRTRIVLRIGGKKA